MADENQSQDGEQEGAAAGERPGPDSWAAAQILEAAPSWATRGVVYLALIIVGTGLAYAGLTRLEVTVRCPAVVQAGQVSRFSAPEAGVTDRVLVGPGQHVRKGEALLLLRPAAWVEGTEPTRLVADADGVVLELAVADRGVAVGKGDLLGTLHPDDAGLKVELKLPNKDAGRVQPGMPIALRMEAYPVAEFGVVRAEVVRIAPVAREDPQLGWIYPVTARLPRDWVEAHGKRFPVRPGMAATAEIVVGRRSMLSSLMGSGGD